MTNWEIAMDTSRRYESPRNTHAHISEIRRLPPHPGPRTHPLSEKESSVSCISLRRPSSPDGPLSIISASPGYEQVHRNLCCDAESRTSHHVSPSFGIERQIRENAIHSAGSRRNHREKPDPCYLSKTRVNRIPPWPRGRGRIDQGPLSSYLNQRVGNQPAPYKGLSGPRARNAEKSRNYLPGPPAWDPEKVSKKSGKIQKHSPDTFRRLSSFPKHLLKQKIIICLPK